MKAVLLLFILACTSSFATEVELDYLLWTVKKSPVPTPLVTTVSFSDAVPGALGQPGSHVKMGETQVDLGWQSGFQIAARSSSDTWVVEGSYFLLPQVRKKSSLSTSGEVGSPSYAVPIYDVTGFWGLNGVPGETIYILPGPLLGTQPGFVAHFHQKVSSFLQGAQLNGLYKNNWGALLMGVRWLDLSESLQFKTHTKSIPGFPAPASFFDSHDCFKTANQFLGLQVGLESCFENDCWQFAGTFKGGVGALFESAHVKGSSITPGGNLFYLILSSTPQQLPGGIFAQTTNRGAQHRVQCAALLEAALRLSYSIRTWLNISAGYDFLWMSKAVRPGDQLDRKINPTLTELAAASRATVGTLTSPTPFGVPGGAQAPQGPKRPRFAFHSSNFWAQGFIFGLEISF